MSSPGFLPGQRWISRTESELGLGVVLEADHRRVTLHFPAADSDRTYSVAEAPLTRVLFKTGEYLSDADGQSLLVMETHEQSGLVLYRCRDEQGEEHLLPETRLAANLRFNRPGERLLSGNLDPAKWFDLREQTYRLRSNLLKSETYGLCGPRVSLIPHQVYIATQVGLRIAPRVLLADEVGLGKTIEAGMIIHQQLLTGKAARVLIIIPETLLHQWLVELLRRFNLSFSIMDESRCAASGSPNPFDDTQLALCSLDFFMRHPQWQAAAMSAEWDLVTVDEAHHLQWTPEESSAEYRFIEQLSHIAPGLLLLTATPEQLGRAAHFARLRLLDPDRFHDLQSFIQEEAAHVPVALAAGKLIGGEALEENERRWLGRALPEFAETIDGKTNDPARDRLIQALLDRHGLGRVLYRNTRVAVGGFPQRILEPAPMAPPKEYTDRVSGEQSLYPERDHGKSEPPVEWTEIDPRVHWLVALCKSMPEEKILVICAHQASSMELEQAMRKFHGVNSAVFHEQLSMIARDRAAAWFAQTLDGAQCLVCSEIGSEGRNFQFSRHLVLFDLPLNPDLLEQRIGRLDRIGQGQAIHIHVPYFSGTSQEILFRWYHQGLNAFASPCPAAGAVYEQTANWLAQAIDGKAETHDLVEHTANLTTEINQALKQGRDRLLELHSCRPRRAAAIIREIRKTEQHEKLVDYLELLCDSHGIDLEELGGSSYLLSPGHHMRVSGFPWLPDEGFSCTLEREVAVSRDDLAYLSWEHPFVTGAMELVTSSDMGSAAFSLIESTDALPRGCLLLEMLFIIDTITPATLNAGHYFPPTLIRVWQDNRGNDLTALLENTDTTPHNESVPPSLIANLVQGHRETIKVMLKQAESAAATRALAFKHSARQQMEQKLGDEIRRLQALRGKNPNVRETEIQILQRQLSALGDAIDSATPRLDAVKLMLAA